MAYRAKGLGDLPPCGIAAPGQLCQNADGSVANAGGTASGGLTPVQYIGQLEQWISAAGAGGSVPSPQSFAQWLNTNGSTIAWIGGGVLALLLIPRLFGR